MRLFKVSVLFFLAIYCAHPGSTNLVERNGESKRIDHARNGAGREYLEVAVHYRLPKIVMPSFYSFARDKHSMEMLRYYISAHLHFIRYFQRRS